MQKIWQCVRKLFFLITYVSLNLSFKIEIKGRENIPNLPSALIVANHTSYLDVFVIGSALFNNLAKIKWVISKENYRLWFFKWIYAIYPVIVVNGTVEKIKPVLVKNHWVVIFPDGANRWCRSDKNFSAKRYTGTAVVALTTGVTVVPVKISGADKALTPESFKLNRQYPITVTIGKPFKFEVVQPPSIEEAILQKTIEEIMERINVN